MTQWVSVQDMGATGNGTTDDSAAFASAVPTMVVPPGTASYLIGTSIAVSADLVFDGGVLLIPSGVTLTINGAVIASSKVIFKGAGTVIVNKGETDVAWFDGTDASSKWAFCARGMQNTNGLGNIAVFSRPALTDPCAADFQIAGNPVWGARWRVDAPILIDSPQQATVIRTPAGFVATSAITCMWQIGTPTNPLKVDYIHFPDKLSIEGNNGMCTYAGIMYGSSHMRVPYQEIYRTQGWLMQPTMNKQVSDVKFDFIDTGGLYGPVLILDGSNGPNNTITDFVCDFISSTGFASGHAPNALVQLNSNYHSIKIGKVSHRAVAPGMVDCTGSVVSLYNVGATPGNYYSPQYDVRIGPVINGSTTTTSQAIIVNDGSSGRAAKFTGVVIEAGSFVNGMAPGNFDMSLDYCSGAIVQGLQVGRNISIDSTCANTKVYGIAPKYITDAGVNTLINGKSRSDMSSVALAASPMTWTNTLDYDVDFSIAGGTVTAVNLVRGSKYVTAYSGAGLGCGIYRVSPNDNIQIAYSGSPSLNIIPR
jgi:hypothetical protein